MKKAIALALAAALLTGLAISALLRQRTPRPERLTAQPTSREMVELVRTLREILIILNFRSCRFHFSGPYGMIPS